MPVEAASGTVIPDRGARVSVGGGFLHIAQRHPGIKRGGDERMAQRVGADFLRDPGAARDPADDPPRTMAIQPPSVRRQEDGTAGALAGGQVDRPGRCGEASLGSVWPSALWMEFRAWCSQPTGLITGTCVAGLLDR